MKKPSIVFAGLLLLGVASLPAAEDRKERVLNDRKEVEASGNWIYNESSSPSIWPRIGGGGVTSRGGPRRGTCAAWPLEEWSMVTSFGPIALAAAIATIFGLLPLAISALAVPRRPDRVKDAPYECGVETIGPTSVQFHNRFYLYALIFVIFDVEAVFLFPWALRLKAFALHGLGPFVFIEMMVFLLILVLGLAYAWRKGVLRWI